MAQKKTEGKTLERTYTVPLRKEFLKVPYWKRTKKAVTALRQFLVKHMKSENVKLDNKLNLHVWKHGGRNPPHHVKVTATKDGENVVKAWLFGTKPVEEKAPAKKTMKKSEEAPVVKEVQKAEEPTAETEQEKTAEPAAEAVPVQEKTKTAKATKTTAKPKKEA